MRRFQSLFERNAGWILSSLVGGALLILPSRIGRLTLGLSASTRSEIATGLLTGAIIGWILLAVERRRSIDDRLRAKEEREARLRAIERTVKRRVLNVIHRIGHGYAMSLADFARVCEALEQDDPSADIAPLVQAVARAQLWTHMAALPAETNTLGTSLVSVTRADRYLAVLSWSSELLKAGSEAGVDLHAPHELAQPQPIGFEVEQVCGDLERSADILAGLLDTDGANRVLEMRDSLAHGWRHREEQPYDWMISAGTARRAVAYLAERPIEEFAFDDVLRRLDPRSGSSEADWWTDIRARHKWLEGLLGEVELITAPEPQQHGVT